MFDAVKSYLHRVHERYKSQREGRKQTVYNLTHDANTLTVSLLTIENETGQDILQWRDVIRVEAFKRDLYVVDQICLLFIKTDGSELEINEEMSGFGEFVQALPTYLPGCQTFGQWYLPVAIPAFELNLTVIYDRSQSS